MTEWFDYIKNNTNKPWNYSYLSQNPNITWEIVQDNPNIPWNYHYLSQNPNITWEIVQDNSEIPWNYKSLSYNKMSKHPFFTKQLSYVLK